MSDINKRIEQEHRMMTVSIITIAVAATALIILFIVLLSNLGIIKLPAFITEVFAFGERETVPSDDYNTWLFSELKDGIPNEYDNSVLDLSAAEYENIIAGFDYPTEFTVRSDVYIPVENGEKRFVSVLYKSGNLMRAEVYDPADHNSCLKVALISGEEGGMAAEYYDFTLDSGKSYSYDEIKYLAYECHPLILEYILAVNSDAEKDLQKLRTQTENVLFLTLLSGTDADIVEERYYISVETGQVTAAVIYKGNSIAARYENISVTEGLSGYGGEREFMFSRFSDPVNE